MTIRPVIGFAVFGCFALLACQEEQVGAPCTPESDDGSFKDQIGITDLVEPGSVIKPLIWANVLVFLGYYTTLDGWPLMRNLAFIPFRLTGNDYLFDLSLWQGRLY